MCPHHHHTGEHSHSRVYAQDTHATKSERHMWRGAWRQECVKEKKDCGYRSGTMACPEIQTQVERSQNHLLYNKKA